MYSPLQKLKHQLGILYFWYSTGNTDEIYKMKTKLQKNVTLRLCGNDQPDQEAQKYSSKLRGQKYDVFAPNNDSILLYKIIDICYKRMFIRFGKLEDNSNTSSELRYVDDGITDF